jgi:hypothetical protein
MFRIQDRHIVHNTKVTLAEYMIDTSKQPFRRALIPPFPRKQQIKQAGHARF